MILVSDSDMACYCNGWPVIVMLISIIKLSCNSVG